LFIQSGSAAGEQLESEIGYKQALAFGKWYAFVDAAMFWQEYTTPSNIIMHCVR